MAEQKNAHGVVSKEIRIANGRIMDLMSVYLNLLEEAVTPAALDELTKSLGVSRTQAYANCLAALCDVGSDRRERWFFDQYFLPMVHEMDPAPFEADPYYHNIKIPAEKLGKWELRMQKIKPCQAFVCDDFHVFEDGRMIPQIGFFPRSFDYPAVLEGGREWMTLMPNETITTLPAIRQAHGKVLTYGLGLGYFVYRVSEKEEVDSITVVELSEDVAKLFRQHILPQFSHPEKVRVVVEDAFVYAENTMPVEHFDFVFADIWHDVGDGRESYIKMKEFEKTCPNTQFSYWLEGTIKCYLDEELWPDFTIT